MKTFCAILFVGIIAFVQSSDDDCDKFAANTYEKTDKTNDEHLDQVIPLDDIMKRTKTKNFVTRVTSSVVEGSSAYCSVVSHGNGCLAVGHWREIIAGPQPQSKEGADKLKLKTVYVAKTGNDYALKYEYMVHGINADDYIFQAQETTIKVTKINNQGNEVGDVTGDVPAGVLAKLKKEYALFYAGDEFALYMTCDATVMWVTYDSTKAANENYLERTKADLEKQITRLKEKVEEDGKQVPTLVDIPVALEQAYSKHLPRV